MELTGGTEENTQGRIHLTSGKEKNIFSNYVYLRPRTEESLIIQSLISRNQ